MKVHELLGTRLLLEDVTLDNVYSLEDLKDFRTGKYYTSEVNVTGEVNLWGTLKQRPEGFVKLPVKFGTVGKIFNCRDNALTSLEGVPREVGGHFDFEFNKLTSLVGVHKMIKKINGFFNVRQNDIKSGGIGLILIEGIANIKADFPAFDIINKYLGQGKKGLLLCQEELIDAGLEEFAKL